MQGLLLAAAAGGRDERSRREYPFSLFLAVVFARLCPGFAAAGPVVFDIYEDLR